LHYSAKLSLNRLFSIPLLRRVYSTLKKFRKLGSLVCSDEVLLFHQKNIIKYNGKVALEIGAGASLYYNLMCSDLLMTQYLYDVSYLLEKKAVNHVLKYLGKESISNIDSLQKEGIYYFAPQDILDIVDFPKSRPDFFLSSSTLEHIPKESLVPILLHLRSLLKRGAYLSIHIDYSDHLSHSDQRCSRNHFLQYSEKKFKKFNSWVCYQNRLRHKHYEEMFLQSGYSIVSEEYLNYDEPPKVVEKSLLTGHESDFFTTGRWVLCSP
jgi:hypothetical protein